ncbi:heparanase-like isoform X2 [Chrysoperla carnea]|uniref:heparanase-like isoform X2 n=1 Tax=Chrysoperla carnea TaxID=189513 RepID=UPI001D0892C9|nr:heparanase-like isoform X2 [Chrysoperla carnea]
MFNQQYFSRFENRLEQYKNNSILGRFVLFAIFFFFLLTSWKVIFRRLVGNETNIIFIDTSKSLHHVTGKYFMSFALDSSNIADGFKTFKPSNPKLINLVSMLGPAYLRIGGNMADQLIYAGHLKDSESIDSEYDGLFENYIMKENQWIELHEFINKTKMELIFDLNVLNRNPDGSWNSTNAENLIHFSANHNYFSHWELGNEPNAFKHQFNVTINATQLAKDFQQLRNILNRYPQYKSSMLLGPDTTRPLTKNSSSVQYFKEFIDSNATVDVLTWHQYYLNGHNTTCDKFYNIKTFEMLETQMKTIKNIVSNSEMKNVPVWLGETSSAYGGGAPNLSDSFIGGFLWLDKLGLAAKHGMDTVIRQSIFGGYYALIDDNYNPNPDWWISLIYKSLVGNRVLNYYTATNKKVRLYCHCTVEESLVDHLQGVTVFGINLNSYPTQVEIQILNNVHYSRHTKVFEYGLTGFGKLTSREIALNNVPLKLTPDGKVPPFKPKIRYLNSYHVMPPFSIVFWVVHGISVPLCQV